MTLSKLYGSFLEKKRRGSGYQCLKRFLKPNNDLSRKCFSSNSRQFSKQKSCFANDVNNVGRSKVECMNITMLDHVSANMVQGDICKENLEWLCRSAVGEASYQIDFETLSNVLMESRIGVSCVREMEMGAFHAMITFASEEDMHQALLDGLPVLQKFFYEIKPWTENEWCISRLIWLDC